MIVITIILAIAAVIAVMVLRDRRRMATEALAMEIRRNMTRVMESDGTDARNRARREHCEHETLELAEHIGRLLAAEQIRRETVVMAQRELGLSVDGDKSLWALEAADDAGRFDLVNALTASLEVEGGEVDRVSKLVLEAPPEEKERLCRFLPREEVYRYEYW